MHVTSLSPFWPHIRAALHIPDSLVGAAALLQSGIEHVACAENRWPDSALTGWKQVLQAAQRELMAAVKVDDRFASQVMSMPTSAAARIVHIQARRVDVHESMRSAVLGRAIVLACIKKSGLSQSLLDGAYLMHRGRSNWLALAKSDITDLEVVHQIRSGTSGVVHGFLGEVQQVLETSIQAHEEVQKTLTAPQNHATPTITEQAALDETGSPVLELESSDVDPLAKTAEQQEDVTAPDIQARLRSADYSNVPTKFGIAGNDHLSPDDLRLVTSKLHEFLIGADPRKSALACWYLVSLSVGFQDRQVLGLPIGFRAGHSIWLELDHGTWGWDRRAYRLEEQHADVPPEVDIVHCPMPRTVITRLLEMREKNPHAASLLDLMKAEIPDLESPERLKNARAFLRTCGESAHQATHGRFSRSLGVAALHITGSDMFTALWTGHFVLTGAAALFYYHPTTTDIWKRADAVLKWLGLEGACASMEKNRRIGIDFYPTSESIKAGWELLCNDVTAKLPLLEHRSEATARLAAADLMVLCCTGLVVMTAHRGSRLEELTLGACLTCEQVMLVLDKVVESRSPARLLPISREVRQFLDIALLCRRYLIRSSTKASWNDPMFFISAADGTVYPVTSEQITRCLRSHFGSHVPANLFRHLWITELEENDTDRWLIRALSGHWRDVTRTAGPYLDIPVIETCQRLNEQMEKIKNDVWQLADKRFPVARVAPPTFKPARDMHAVATWATESRVPDPRIILSPLDVVVLTQYQAVERVRSSFAQGLGGLSSPAAAFISICMLDLVHNTDIALKVAKGLHPLQRHGLLQGIAFAREYSTIPTWLPISTVSSALLTATSQKSGSGSVEAEVSEYLRRVDGDFWHRDPDELLVQVAQCVLSFVRLRYPPSLAAMAHPTTPAPSLSPRSLQRLANPDCVNLPQQLEARKYRQPKSRKATPILDDVLRVLNYFADTTIKLGELQKRAKQCIKEVESIRSIQLSDTYLSGFILDWVIDELRRSAVLEKDCLRMSSLSTYLGILRSGYSRLLVAQDNAARSLLQSDPADWENPQWLSWIDTVAASVAHQHDRQNTDDIDQAALGRAREPLLRLVRNLIKRDHPVSRSVFKKLLVDQELQRTGSSSSVFIQAEDIEQARELAKVWYADSPLDLWMFKARLLIQSSIPTRSSEISSLPFDCVSTNAMLLVNRIGYSVHKTDNAIRTIQLNRQTYDSLNEIREGIRAHQPPAAPLLLRGRGEQSDGRRDQGLVDDLSAALKQVTRDPKARPHSLRARAVQEITWPGWESHVKQLLRAGLRVQEAKKWITSLQTEWYRATYAASQAGHGDLRAGLGNYFSSWSLIYYVHAQALLSEVDLGADLLALVGLKRNSFIAARRRADGELEFWDWLQNSLRRRNQIADPCGPQKSSIAPEDPAHPSPPYRVYSYDEPDPQYDSDSQDINLCYPALIQSSGADNAPPASSQINFTTAVILGIKEGLAQDLTGVSPSFARHVAANLDADFCQKITARARTAAGMRAIAAHKREFEQALRSTTGDVNDLLRFLEALAPHSKTALFASIKGTRNMCIEIDWAEIWKDCASHLPSHLSLVVQRGNRHPRPAERMVFASAGAALVLQTRRDIGARPVVSIRLRNTPANRVVQSRLSSYLKAALYANHFLTFERNFHV